MKHKWRELAVILNAPYDKRFSTNGYGDFRIDNKGLYSYEEKEYSDAECWNYLSIFSSGEIKVVDEGCVFCKDDTNIKIAKKVTVHSEHTIPTPLDTKNIFVLMNCGVSMEINNCPKCGRKLKEE